MTIIVATWPKHADLALDPRFWGELSRAYEENAKQSAEIAALHEQLASLFERLESHEK